MAGTGWALNLVLVSRVAKWVLNKTVLSPSGRHAAKSLANVNLRQHIGKLGAAAHSRLRLPLRGAGELQRVQKPANTFEPTLARRLRAEVEVPALPAAAAAGGPSLPVTEGLAGAVLITALMQQALRRWGGLADAQQQAGRLAEAARQQAGGAAASVAEAVEGFSAGMRAEASSTAATAGGLVIRIFGRWPEPGEWVNIVNIPLEAEGVSERFVRALLAAEEEKLVVRHLSRALVTASVTTQVWKAINDSVWGTLTTDLWKGSVSRPQHQFEIGYEVVEVPTQERQAMLQAARAMGSGGTPGRVHQVPQTQASLMLWFDDRALRSGRARGGPLSTKGSSASP